MADQKHHGLNVDPNPFVEQRTSGGVPKQTQPWPGSDARLDPPADHGQESYQGGGKLRGRVALITGGDSGIGRAVAIAFAREGADVAICYYDEHEDARETEHWVREAGRKALVMDGDVQDPDVCQRWVDRTVEELGGLNILVNNAAYQNQVHEFLELSPEQIDRTFRTNIFGYIYMAQRAIPHLQPGDTIINTGSVVAPMGFPPMIDYACTKAAIHNFTQTLAQALAEKGIRVNCVAPGPVWTPLIPATTDEQFVSEFGTDAFWKRAQMPAELAPTYVYLASSDSRFMSGEIIANTGYKITSR